MTLESILNSVPVIPVLVIEDTALAVPLAHALVKGGLTVLEITLRTSAALDCMRAVMAEVEGATVGAGTVLSEAQLDQVAAIGCAFAVSPGSTPRLLAAARESSVPLLPGAATASESMALFDQGYVLQKFFPAEPAGGPPYLAALASPLPQVRFCPTGGITAETAPQYLHLSNVIAVGGSWMAPRKLLATRDWPTIEALALAASNL